HLKALKEAGLVADRQEGTRRGFFIDPHGLGALRRWLDQFLGEGVGAVPAGGEMGERGGKGKERRRGQGTTGPGARALSAMRARRTHSTCSPRDWGAGGRSTTASARRRGKRPSWRPKLAAIGTNWPKTAHARTSARSSCGSRPSVSS